MKYLNDYNDFCKNGAEYLCIHYKDDKTFELFLPTVEELSRHISDGFVNSLGLVGAWGSYLGEAGPKFNDFRQNIVLFLAVMNGEY